MGAAFMQNVRMRKFHGTLLEHRSEIQEIAKGLIKIGASSEPMTAPKDWNQKG